jgi:asparagine synthase (glutamine-hydrolysing)
MCGFAGFISQHCNATGSSDNARRMAAALAHRGPDDEGVWTDDGAGVALAHRRLSIVDLSLTGHQPMHSACGRWVITFNGEIYNFAELRDILMRQGKAPQWRGHSDTEVLLAGIAAWGVPATLERSIGMFAFAVWDRQKRTMWLARDRLGEKPLYYGLANGTFLFGSDFAALSRHPSWSGDIDRYAVALLMRHGHVPAPYAIYSGFHKLEPAAYLAVDVAGQARERGRYWNAGNMALAGERNPITMGPAEAVAEVERQLRRSLKGQMVADVPLGAFLSGGIDSSAVVAVMQAMSGKPVKTFTVGFTERGYDEASHARVVAKHLGTDHHELTLTEADTLEMVPRLAHVYSEPFADASQIPMLLVSRMARQHVTVALSGDGGDELFSGYNRYQLAGRFWPALQATPRPVRQAVAKLVQALPYRSLERAARWSGSALPEGLRPRNLDAKILKVADILASRSIDDAYDQLVSHWRDDSIVLCSDAPADDGTASVIAPDFASPIHRMMYRDLTGYLHDDVLTKVDRATMAYGLEARVPLLDHRLVEFTWRLPLSILRNEGRSKWPLRQILFKYVPRELVERPKMGFAVPIDTWLRGPLRDWAETLLAPRRLRHDGILDPRKVEAAWRAHLSGSANLQQKLWNVLMFQAWLDGLKQDQRPCDAGNPLSAARAV